MYFLWASSRILEYLLCIKEKRWEPALLRTYYQVFYMIAILFILKKWTLRHRKETCYTQHNSGCKWLTRLSPKPMLSPLDLSHSTKELNMNYVPCTIPSASDQAMLRCIYYSKYYTQYLTQCYLNKFLSRKNMYRLYEQNCIFLVYIYKK